MTVEFSSAPERDRKVPRQGDVDEGDTPSRTSAERADLALVQARAAATSFLRLRPVVVVPAAVAQGLLLLVSRAPAHQVQALCAGLLVTSLAFVAESSWLRGRQVSLRWLQVSLAATLVALAAACTLSGGAASPLLPLLFAPIVTAFAAFGRSLYAGALLVATVLLLAAFGLETFTSADPSPALLPREVIGPMTLVSTLVGLALSWIAVTGFAGAYARTAQALDHLRLLEAGEARDRARTVESIGAIVAHEIKNPLTAIKGLIQLAAERPTDARDAKRMAVVLGEVERIESTLADYLAFSRPLPELRAEPVALDRLVDDIAATLEGRAAFAGVRLVRDGRAASVSGDARRLREAVLNLATNAIEAMPRGGTLRLVVAPQDGGGATVTVEDEGEGLPEGALNRPFRSHKDGGSGLGLLVVQRAAKSHGGRLTAAPAPGGGTRITLSLPLAPPPREGAPGRSRFTEVVMENEP